MHVGLRECIRRPTMSRACEPASRINEQSVLCPERESWMDCHYRMLIANQGRLRELLAKTICERALSPPGADSGELMHMLGLEVESLSTLVTMTQPLVKNCHLVALHSMCVRVLPLSTTLPPSPIWRVGCI